MEYGPVVGEPLTRHDGVRDRVAGATLVGGGDGRVDEKRRDAAAAVVVCATERRPGRQEDDGQLVPGDRELEQRQRERYPKLPPTEIAQGLLHRVVGFVCGGNWSLVDVRIAFFVTAARVQMLLFRVVCHCGT